MIDNFLVDGVHLHSQHKLNRHIVVAAYNYDRLVIVYSMADLYSSSKLYSLPPNVNGSIIIDVVDSHFEHNHYNYTV